MNVSLKFVRELNLLDNSASLQNICLQDQKNSMFVCSRTNRYCSVNKRQISWRNWRCSTNFNSSKYKFSNDRKIFSSYRIFLSKDFFHFQTQLTKKKKYTRSPTPCNWKKGKVRHFNVQENWNFKWTNENVRNSRKLKKNIFGENVSNEDVEWQYFQICADLKGKVDICFVFSNVRTFVILLNILVFSYRCTLLLLV